MNRHSKYKLTIPIGFKSNRNEKEREVNHLLFKEAKPSRALHNFATIKWLNHRCGKNHLKKSIFSLLPNNGKPVISDEETEEEKKKRLLKEWLSTYCQPKEICDIDINPKYLFNEETFKKILKLKSIFLEFDEDGSRKMELDEMEEMFHKNKLFVSTKELIDLFFKGQKIKKEQIKNLYLDFYQFINFALNKDQDFREFMRNVRKQYCSHSGTKEGMNFIPMNFDLVLDYFIVKGKERASKEVISNSINVMNDTINLIKDNQATSISNNYFDYSLLDKLDYNEIINEFTKLFKGAEYKKTKTEEDYHHGKSLSFSSGSFINKIEAKNNISQESISGILSELNTLRESKTSKLLKLNPILSKNAFRVSLKKKHELSKDNSEGSTTMGSKIFNNSHNISLLSGKVKDKQKKYYVKDNTILPKIINNSMYSSPKAIKDDYVPLDLLNCH